MAVPGQDEKHLERISLCELREHLELRNSGLDSTLASRVTLVGHTNFLDLSFLIYKTKGVLTFSDPLEALGGRNKLMFGKPCVTLPAKTLSKYKVNYRNCLLSH